MKYYKHQDTYSGSYPHTFDDFEWVTLKTYLEVNQKINTYLQSFKIDLLQYSLAVNLVEIAAAMQRLYRILKQWRYAGETPVMTIENLNLYLV